MKPPVLMRLQAALLSWAGIRTIRDHYVWTSGLSSHSVVLDLGANVGEFSKLVTRDFGCRCVAVEPEAANFSKISGDRIVKLQVAAGSNDGVASLFKFSNEECHSLFLENYSRAERQGSEIVNVLSFRSILASSGASTVDLMKLDIEGGEWSFLASLTDMEIQDIRQITVEFHDFIPELRRQSRTAETRSRLGNLGFICIEDIYVGSYNTLFLNTRKVPFIVKMLAKSVVLIGNIRNWKNGLRTTHTNI